MNRDEMVNLLGEDNVKLIEQSDKENGEESYSIDIHQFTKSKTLYPTVFAIGLGMMIGGFILLVISFFFPKLGQNSTTVQSNRIVDVSDGRFVILDKYYQSDDMDSSITYYVAYEKATDVMYLIGKSEGSSPTFTVMVSKNGYPISYRASEEEEGK